MRKYTLDKEELKAIVMLYRLMNPFMTPNRIYARWSCGKLNLLKDNKIWAYQDFISVTNEIPFVIEKVEKLEKG